MRRRGELLRDRDPSNAEAQFSEALEIARHQEAKLWESRRSTRLRPLASPGVEAIFSAGR
jgi:hypothetical protein